MADESLNPEPTDLPDPAGEPVSPRHQPVDSLPEGMDPDAEDRPRPESDEGA